uniref:Non-specific serine/threonine protein kinase n=1 Tax=Lactuca sativa TaxID=4236 RepID=A0A9R1WZ88_LACSA|nr:hypothetical protein LSAT_V11C800449580 [Lactuca sativa]
MSWNKLTGDIPSTLTNLPFLSSLNLSYNQLEGRIPAGSQFQTFQDTLYKGDIGLCGSPWMITNKDFDLDLSYNNFSENTVPSGCDRSLNLYRSYSTGNNSFNLVVGGGPNGSREVYDLVVCIQLCKPGMSIQHIHNYSVEKLCRGLKAMGILKDLEENVEKDWNGAWESCKYHLDLCKNVFGEGVYPVVDATNGYYGGKNIAGSTLGTH